MNLIKFLIILIAVLLCLGHVNGKASLRGMPETKEERSLQNVLPVGAAVSGSRLKLNNETKNRN